MFFPALKVHLIENEEERKKRVPYTLKINIKNIIFAEAALIPAI